MMTMMIQHSTVILSLLSILTAGSATTNSLSSTLPEDTTTTSSSRRRAVETEDTTASSEIIYVFEPCEHLNSDYEWTNSGDVQFLVKSKSNNDNNNVTVEENEDGGEDVALFGSSSFQLGVKNDGIANNNNNESPHTTSSSFIQALLTTGSHNCRNADYISLWYRPHIDRSLMTEESEEDVVEIISPRLKVTIFDEINSLSRDIELPSYNPQSSSNNEIFESKWEEIRIDEDIQTLDLRLIKGYKFELQNSTSPAYKILFDQIACHGGPEMFGNPFYLPDGSALQDAVLQEKTFKTEFYQSDLSRSESIMQVQDGTTYIDYTVEQTESWGGFISLTTISLGGAYFNLTNGNELIIDYNVLKTASVPERVSLRITLADTSDCTICFDEQAGVDLPERWYSFHSILDSEGPGQLRIPLVGDTEPGESFWLTGWAGTLGNSKFDKENIESIEIELSMDSVLGFGSIVTGAIELSNIRVVNDYLSSGGSNANNEFPSGSSNNGCALEEDVHFDESSALFTRYEHKAYQCCELCERGPDCLYAATTGVGHCYTASYLDPDVVGLANTDTRRIKFKALWMDDSTKRGDFCHVCSCNEESQTIDCRGRDLRILPKLFTETWKPKIIDLRNNEKLVFIGSGSLSHVPSDNIEVVLIGKEMKHIAPSVLSNMPSLRQLGLGDSDGGKEDDDEGLPQSLNNYVSKQIDSFSDVCCGFGDTIQIGAKHVLTQCDMQFEKPGIDSIYLPFTEFFSATPLEVLTSRTEFMGEAADSPEMCAGYCTINKSCRYFGYDARVKNAEHICYLLKDRGIRSETVCCEDDHYADLLKTQPGYVSGSPPQTRHDENNATVVISEHNYVANAENGFVVEYKVSLASTPLRGAVWIEPEVPPQHAGQVDISPPRVVLYNTNQTATVKVAFEDPKNGIVAVIGNKITSCDTAFMLGDSKDQIVYITVENEEGLKLGVVVVLSILAALLLALPFVIWLLIWSKKGQEEAFWKVERSELRFDVPPIVLGRGTFGLVLLGRYRGTKVAVKRVLPAADKSLSLLTTAKQLDEPSSLDIDIEEGQSEEALKYKDVPPTRVERKSSIQLVSMSLMASLFDPWNGSAGTRRERKISSESPKPRVAASNETSKRRLTKEFVKEMKFLSKLRHPCITTVMGAVVDNTIDPMLVMEHMENGSLYDLLHNETLLIEKEMLLPILCDVTQGMRFLHSANPVVIHGDLKAQNILVDCKWRAKVSDFGLSVRVCSNNKHTSRRTVGTPWWMAPELLRQESGNTTSSDVYSFGMLLYEVLSRKDPYEGEDPTEVLRQIADRNIQKRPPTPPNCKPELQAMMAECLRDDPKCRPDFHELDERLKREQLQEIKPVSRRFKESSIKNASLDDNFPSHIAAALEDGRSIEPENHDCVTVVCIRIADFPSLASSVSPEKMSDLISRLYTQLDSLAQKKHDVFKVETNGDVYMAATNLVKDQEDDHVKRIAAFSVEAVEVANSIHVDVENPSLGMVKIQVGFHCGQVMSDVIGAENPRYCLFGECVNVALRMESNAEANRIQCSTTAAEILMDQDPFIPLRSRGQIEIKGKGLMHTFWVNETTPVVSPSSPPDQLPKVPRRSDSYAAREDRAMLEWAFMNSSRDQNPNKRDRPPTYPSSRNSNTGLSNKQLEVMEVMEEIEDAVIVPTQ